MSHSAIVLVVIALLVGGYAALSASSVLDTVANSDALRDVVERLGWFGPIAVVALMTLAVVMSPIPSAPIALAAGAAYGHTWGTLYVLIGAEAQV